MVGVQAWSELADAAVSAKDLAAVAATADALVLLGVSADVRRDLSREITGRVDSAGVLLRDVLDRARDSSEPAYAAAPPASERQMDRAISQADRLLGAGPGAIMSGPAGVDELWALPPDRAGALVAGLLEAVVHQPDPARRAIAVSEIEALASRLAPTRLPVARLVTVAVALAADGAAARSAIARILSRVTTERLLPGWPRQHARAAR